MASYWASTDDIVALSHYGIKGQRWGYRRYQNEDGSYTEAGKKRYAINSEGKPGTKKGEKKLRKDYRKRLSDLKSRGMYGMRSDKLSKLYMAAHHTRSKQGNKEKDKALRRYRKEKQKITKSIYKQFGGKENYKQAEKDMMTYLGKKSKRLDKIAKAVSIGVPLATFLGTTGYNIYKLKRR